MPERRLNPTPVVLNIALEGAGLVLASLALLLLASAAGVLFLEDYRGLQNDGCNLPEGLARTMYVVAAGAGAAAAAIVAIGLVWRSVKRHRRAMLAAAVSALVAAALGASLSFMLDPAVDTGPCTQWKLDRARWLFGVTGTIAAISTLFVGRWLLHRSIGRARQPLLWLAVAIAASLPCWACAWWMFTILGSSE